MDANARNGEKIEGERTEDDGVLGAYGRDELNKNGKRLLNFATDNKLAVTNTFFSTHKGGISHTYNGVIGFLEGFSVRHLSICTVNAVVPDDPQKDLVVRRPELPIVSVTRGPRHAPVQQSLHGLRLQQPSLEP